MKTQLNCWNCDHYNVHMYISVHVHCIYLPNPCCTQRHIWQELGISSLFLAILSTSPQVRFMSLSSFSTVPPWCFWSAFLSFPLWGSSLISATLVILFVGFLKTWLIHLHLYFLSNVLISVVFLILNRFLLVIFACQNIKIFLRPPLYTVDK